MTSLLVRKLFSHSNINVCLKNYSVASTCISLGRECSQPVIFNKSALHNSHQNIQVRFAGHSKWQNIKHIKGAKDAERSVMFSRISLLIKSALKGGSSNPVSNSKLAEALELAKKNNMPKATTDKIINKSSNSNKNAKRAFLEYRGTGGICLLIELMTDNLKRSRNYCNAATKKNPLSFNLSQSQGSVKRLFNERGYITCSPKGDLKDLTIDIAEEHAIEVGAEDVSLCDDYVEFFTDIVDLHKVQKELENFNYTINECCISFIPEDPIAINDEIGEALTMVVDKLEDIEDVEKVYVNVQ